MTTFKELGVPSPVVKVLNQTGKTTPFPIQADTLPDSLAGRDILGRGQTGSGKTLAFTIPMVARLADSAGRSNPSHPRGLVLAPTRELATQIAEEIKPIAGAYGLRVTTIFGGVSQRPQEKALRSGIDIVVACPGRLEDLMNQGVIHVDQVEIAVLDEADHMADLGFLPGVNRIMAETPANGQRMLFSATLDRDVNKIVNRFLHDPARHEVDTKGVPTDAMSHHVFVVKGPDEKTQVVEHLASGQGRRILFTRTKHQAERLALRLNKAGIPAVDLHGNLSQRVRDKNLAAFSKDPLLGGVRVLVATDVAARGVHVDDVEMVVHVDPPAEHKAYLHRSGRTARAGASGNVVTLAFANQRREVAKILKQASVSAEPEFVTAGSAEVSLLVGVPAELAAPRNAPLIDDPAQSRRRPKTQQSRGDRGRSSGRRGDRDRRGGNERPRSNNRKRDDDRSRSNDRNRDNDRRHDSSATGEATEYRSRKPQGGGRGSERSERTERNGEYRENRRHSDSNRGSGPGRKRKPGYGSDETRGARPKRKSNYAGAGRSESDASSSDSSRPKRKPNSRSAKPARAGGSARAGSGSRTGSSRPDGAGRSGNSSRPGKSTRNGKPASTGGTSRPHNKKKARHSQKRRAASN